MNRYMSKFTFGLVSLIISLDLMACSCNHFSLIKNWERSDTVFIANLTELKTIKKGNSETHEQGEVHGFFDVLSSLKGDPNVIIHFEAAETQTCCACSATLQKGKYLVFTSAKGALHYTMCSPTKHINSLSSVEYEVLSYLKSGKAPEKFTGIYDRESETIKIETEEKAIRVIEFNQRFYTNKSLVIINGYRLTNQNIYFVDEEVIL